MKRKTGSIWYKVTSDDNAEKIEAEIAQCTNGDGELGTWFRIIFEDAPPVLVSVGKSMDEQLLVMGELASRIQDVREIALSKIDPDYRDNPKYLQGVQLYVSKPGERTSTVYENEGFKTVTQHDTHYWANSEQLMESDASLGALDQLRAVTRIWIDRELNSSNKRRYDDSETLVSILAPDASVA